MHADLMFQFIMAHKSCITSIFFYCLLFHERGKQNFMYRAKQYHRTGLNCENLIIANCEFF